MILVTINFVMSSDVPKDRNFDFGDHALWMLVTISVRGKSQPLSRIHYLFSKPLRAFGAPSIARNIAVSTMISIMALFTALETQNFIKITSLRTSQ